MLTTVVGGMFAGKSTELQRQGKRYELAKLRVLYIKPSTDDRYATNQLVTHDGKAVRAINVVPSNEVVDLYKFTYKYDVFIIDEVQFFTNDLIAVVKHFLEMGRVVVCGGLDLDFEGEPFPITSQLLSLAENVIKLKAVCDWCGSDAYVTPRHDETTTEKVVVGNEYFPLCRKCFNQYKYNL